MKKNTFFYSEGCKISADIYYPDDLDTTKKYPVIILCHGFAGIKELLLPSYAYEFIKNGYLVLAFDYRGFGESEGESGRLSPLNQVTDIRNAITFMQTIPEADHKRIALWGTSYGGANCITVVFYDKRVKCISVQLTFANGERVITSSMSDEEKEKLFNTIAKMQQRKVTQNKEMMLPVNKILSDEQSIEFYNENIESFPQLNIKMPFLTVKETIDFKPEEFLKYIEIPILITAAGNDMVNPVEESRILYKLANEPKELYVIEDASHYELYSGDILQKVLKKQLQWFDNYL